MAPSGGRSPYAPNAANLNEAAAYAYDLEGGGQVPQGHGGGGASKLYDPRALTAYDVRSRHAPTSGYYPNEEEAHFGPPGTSSYGAEYGDGGYFSPQQRPPRGQTATWGYAGAPMGPQAGGFIEDEYVTAFSEEEADELDSRLSRIQGGQFESQGRAKSMLRANEIERERSRRRQTIVKNKTGSKLFPGRLKLSMMNTGLIPLKKGKKSLHIDIERLSKSAEPIFKFWS